MLDRIIQEVPALGGRLFASVALQLTTIFQTLKSLRNMSISTSGNTISPERNRSSSLSKVRRSFFDGETYLFADLYDSMFDIIWRDEKCYCTEGDIC